ncbi:uncharacterized protein LOC111641815 [Centruroides sculpturatus]|uniref:uncharacterized protein LOC111641815 n=1 Tax=Centruroides sculpturatus TaxID=218467 RepID=UPI000C6CD5C5|nr:uncharacterized protein LOC111641815 [Centruroides sculpturatus]
MLINMSSKITPLKILSLKTLYTSKEITIMENYGYKYRKYIDFKGGFLLLMLDRTGREVTVRIRNKVSDGERLFWPLLSHPNILILIQALNISKEMYAFIMPACLCTLEERLKMSSICKKSWGYLLCKKWIREILDALSYLHDNKLYLVNLQIETIMLSSYLNAMISDFTSLTDMEYIVDPLQLKLSNYEFRDIITKTGTYSTAKLDLWEFGIFALQVITRGGIKELIKRYNYENVICDQERLRTILPNILADPIDFKKILKHFHPYSSDVTIQDAALCLEFLSCFLIEDNQTSITLLDGLEHVYLQPWKDSELRTKYETCRCYNSSKYRRYHTAPCYRGSMKDRICAVQHGNNFQQSTNPLEKDGSKVNAGLWERIKSFFLTHVLTNCAHFEYSDSCSNSTVIDK